MDPITPLLRDLTLLIGCSVLVAYVAQRFFGVVPIVGFLIAGVLIGPEALGFVSDVHMVELAAEIGVILLLFTIGIEFSLERLGRIRRLIFAGGSLQLLVTAGVTTGGMMAFGVDWRPAVYTGLLATLSSTVIVLKLLADRGATGSSEGQAALGILLFQDLAVVVMVLLLPVLAGSESGGGGVLLALARSIVTIGGVLLLARWLMPAFLERVARACSPDIFLLTLVAICFGTAWLAAAVGVGVSLGAFLAGLIVSESRFSEHALSEILPLRILFSGAFFVSIGMLLDPAFLLERPVLVVGIVVAVVLVKAAAASAALLALRTSAAVSIPAGFMLAQVGEFSFVLERRGAELGLHPGGFAEGGGQAFIAASVLLMIATPALSALGRRLAPRPRIPRGAAPAKPTEPVEAVRSGHVIVAGYGERARSLTRYLTAAGVDLTILTLNPDGAREAEADGNQVLRGDYSRRPILEGAGIDRARVLVVADDDPTMTERVVSVAAGIRPDLALVAQTERLGDSEALHRAGAQQVVAAEGSADRELARRVLATAGVDSEDIAIVLAGFAPDGPGVRLTPDQVATGACGHATGIGVVRPRTPGGCEECMAEGRAWVHLRLCMTCGHVGCCDDSSGRHATAHHQSTGHPIVRSWEPGESWAWCYTDQVDL